MAGKSGISQARSRLGEAPLRRLYEELVQADRHPRHQGGAVPRLASLHGTCLDVADTEENRAAFGAPGASRGESAFPQLRLVALVENGTHVLFGARRPLRRGRGDAGAGRAGGATARHAVPG